MMLKEQLEKYKDKIGDTFAIINKMKDRKPSSKEVRPAEFKVNNLFSYNQDEKAKEYTKDFRDL